MGLTVATDESGAASAATSKGGIGCEVPGEAEIIVCAEIGEFSTIQDETDSLRALANGLLAQQSGSLPMFELRFDPVERFVRHCYFSAHIFACIDVGFHFIQCDENQQWMKWGPRSSESATRPIRQSGGTSHVFRHAGIYAYVGDGVASH